MKEQKIFTAWEFSRAPLKAFDAAANGNLVVINHDQFRAGVFELKYRPRCGFSEQPDPGLPLINVKGE